jgi:hypothetical protein
MMNSIWNEDNVHSCASITARTGKSIVYPIDFGSSDTTVPHLQVHVDTVANYNPLQNRHKHHHCIKLVGEFMPGLTMARPQPFARNFTDPSLVASPPYLRSQTHWIRNTLDLQIAQSGPEALTANDLLDIDSFLRGLLPHASEISTSTLRSTRIHLAVLDICGRATRWPLKVIERAEAIGAVWEGKYGSLSSIGWDVDVEGWDEVVEKSEGVVLNGSSIENARRFGDLGFKPGEYVIRNIHGRQ